MTVENERIENNENFGEPPKFSEDEYRQLCIKVDNLPSGESVKTPFGDSVHNLKSLLSVLILVWQRGNNKGWTKELNEKFNSYLSQTKNEIVRLELEKAKSLGL